MPRQPMWAAVTPPRVPGVTVSSRPACKTIYGSLYRARTESGDVALKVFDATAARQHWATAHGRRLPEDADTEVTVLTQARAQPHPNLMAAHPVTDTLQRHGVVTTSVKDACRVHRPLVTATQWCDGGEVFAELSRMRQYGAYVPIEDVRWMFVHAARGLAHLHSLGWAHMDVSPENLLLAGSGTTRRVVLADFGLCLPLGRSTTLTCSRGKDWYASPEAMLLGGGDGAIEDLRRCDVYSLGVTLFVMLAGCRLYSDFKDRAFQHVVSGKIDALVAAWGKGARFSGGAMDLVQRMVVCHEPERRLTLEQVLAHPWCAGVPDPTQSVASTPRVAVATSGHAVPRAEAVACGAGDTAGAGAGVAAAGVGGTVAVPGIDATAPACEGAAIPEEADTVMEAAAAPVTRRTRSAEGRSPACKSADSDAPGGCGANTAGATVTDSHPAPVEAAGAGCAPRPQAVSDESRDESWCSDTSKAQGCARMVDIVDAYDT